MNQIIYENPKEDKWYLYKGVKPPERQSHGITEDEIEDIIEANNKHTCAWKQKGNYVFCREGDYEHGKNIGVHKRLVDSKNGKPVLVDI